MRKKIIWERGNLKLKERDESKERDTDSRGWSAEKQQQKIEVLIVAFGIETCFLTIWRRY